MKKSYGYKIDNIYQKAKIKNLEQSLEFQKYNVKEKKKEKKERKNEQRKTKQDCKNYKENTGTKFITNTKKQKVKNLEQSLEFQKYNVKKKKKEEEDEK